MTQAPPGSDQTRSWSIVGRDDSPGGSLRHPAVLAMLALWVLNDHVFKSAFANTWTGKLSDVASLAVFPLLPMCAYELVCAYRSRPAHRRRAILLTSLVATGGVMVGINICDLCAEGYRVGLGAAQWPIRALWGLVWEGTIPPLRRVILTMDPTDLWTLPALALPWWVGRTRREPPREETTP